MTADATLKRERVRQRFDNLTEAHKHLKDALSRDTAHDDVLRGGLIQFFEFTFELCWKLMKDMLEVDGVVVAAPRDVMKEAFQLGYFSDGKVWIEMLDARNKIAHLYDEKKALLMEKDIRERYAPLIGEFYDYLTHTWLG